MNGLPSTEAPRRAGYGKAYSAKGAQLLKHPSIAKALDEVHMQIRERTLFDVEHAMAECDKMILFAKEHKNAMQRQNS